MTAPGERRAAAREAFRAGRYEEAAALARPLADADAADIAAAELAGAALLQTGAAEAAIPYCERVAVARPDSHGARMNLAEAYRLSGRLDAAMPLFDSIAAADPTNASALCSLGHARFAAGDPGAAVAAYRAAARLRPGDHEIRRALGEAAIAAGDPGSAVAAFRAVLRARPDDLAARTDFGRACVRAGAGDEAARQFDAVLAAQPDFAPALMALANLRHGEECFEEAAALLARAVDAAPGDARAHNLLGLNLQNLGRLDEAVAAYRRAIACDPAFVRGYYQLVQARRLADADATLVDEMENLLQRLPGRGDETITLRFALAKALDDLGRYDAAFAHAEAANRLKGGAYDARHMAVLVDGLIASFPPDLLHARRDWGVADDLPVFVIGMARSGTTLVEQILSAHRDVMGGGELGIVPDHVHAVMAREKRGRPYPVFTAALDRDAVGALAAGCLAAYRGRAGDARHVTDKQVQNYVHVGLIASMFPRARFVWCRRDPRDVCLSNYFQHFTLRLDVANDLAALGHFAVHHRRLMEHWMAALDGRMIAVDYEDLVADPEPAIRRLVDHCGLAWDATCLDFTANRRAVKTASNAQVREPLYDRSVGRWRAYAAHLGPLLAALDEPGASKP